MLHKMTVGWLILGGGGVFLGLKSIIASAHAVSFIMKNTWVGVAIFRKCF